MQSCQRGLPMDDVREVTAQLLADKPRLTDELPEVIKVDERNRLL